LKARGNGAAELSKLTGQPDIYISKQYFNSITQYFNLLMQNYLSSTLSDMDN